MSYGEGWKESTKTVTATDRRDANQKESVKMKEGSGGLKRPCLVGTNCKPEKKKRKAITST